MKTLRQIMAPMRDGIRLACDVYRPDDDMPYPALLMRTPYRKERFAGEWLFSGYEALVNAGYNVVIQDVRGVEESEGTLLSSGASEADDGYDTVEWTAAQPWCDGRVGMYGLSYFGFTQMAAAAMRPPHLLALCPFQNSALLPFSVTRRMTLNCYHLAWLYAQVLDNLERTALSEVEKEEVRRQIAYYREHWDEVMFRLPLRDTPAARIANAPLLMDFVELVDGVETDEFWKRARKPLAIAKIEEPMFFLTGWFDVAKDGTLENYAEIMVHGTSRAKETSRLIIGPWLHGGGLSATVDGYDFGGENSGEARGVDRMTLEWFDRWLKHKKTPDDPRVSVFVLGENRWYEGDCWPPENAKDMAFYLQKNGLTEAAAETEETDTYMYDPENPLPSRFTDMVGRTTLADPAVLEGREDVRVYRTLPLTRDLPVMGKVRLRLFAATSAADTDFFSRLSDQEPGGVSFPLVHGVVRARFRNGRHSEPVACGEVVEYEIDLGDIACRIREGHRLRLEISSSNYPEYDRNLNTGAPIGQGTYSVTARQTLCFGGAHPSRLLLPVAED